MFHLSRALVFIACLAFILITTPTFWGCVGVFTVAMIFTWPMKGAK